VATRELVGVPELASGPLEWRSGHRRVRNRGWLVRRMLLLSDLVGLTLAFAVGGLAVGGAASFHDPADLAIFAATLPGWVVVAKLYGLYEHDEERADHSTADELMVVFNLVTVGAWLFFVGVYVARNSMAIGLSRLVAFWLLAVVCVTLGRAVARALCRRSVLYVQNTVIVGAGEIGQLVARKLLQHPEYGLNLVGFVDDRPMERRGELEHLALLGGVDRLPELIDLLDVERVVIAFSNCAESELVELVRSLRDVEVQVDFVSRLFDLVGPKAAIHTVEGLPLVGLPPVRLSRSSLLFKRAVDLVGATVGLLIAAPFFPVIALLIRLDSEGPVFFRQTRLGLEMREFPVLKFRTLRVDTDVEAHRAYIAQTMDASAAPNANGLYKLDRRDTVTRVGSWLRRTSLDELPQLVNVLRGQMSLVGPRPCIDYETRYFAAHHYERFLVPAGLTGLWQVTARARSTFGEALDMDVAYARGWSLGLDLRLLCRTPVQLLRSRGTA
jgi:exopolysaccharide biosynthesis polyprenyl glycosylphosphotransferase